MPARRYFSLDDYEQHAKRFFPPPIWAYIAGGAETETGLRDNLAAFTEYGFIPHMLVGVKGRTQKTMLFGREWASPFGIAPMGMSALTAYRGDLVMARAAKAANVPMIMSGSSLIRMEEVAAENPDAWFQAYVPGEPERILKLIDRVEAAGFNTLVVTGDVPVSGNRENNQRAGFSTPLRPSLRLAIDGLLHPGWTFGTFLRTWAAHGMPHFENSQSTRGAPILARNVLRDFGARDHLNWEHLALIRKRWTKCLIVKGVMNPADAVRIRDHGAQGIIVSNHGGRQLDGTVAPLRVLPSIAQAVGKEMVVMMDGGIRRGTDIMKAMALGAEFTFIGRPFNYAASVAGEPGLRDAITLLHEEISRNMAILGINALAEMTPESLMRFTEGLYK
ncbi:MAG TPA: alpha-hydroxy acid oxidase [Burkholderiales bacterium]